MDTDPDPGLDEIGARQAIDVAARLASHGPLPILTSPLLRCRQTATPLAEMWSVEVAVEPAVSEIPSPRRSRDGRPDRVAACGHGGYMAGVGHALHHVPRRPSCRRW